MMCVAARHSDTQCSACRCRQCPNYLRPNHIHLAPICKQVIIHQPWIASPVAMSLALLAMQLTATTHPPGGATALIAASFETLPKWCVHVQSSALHTQTCSGWSVAAVRSLLLHPWMDNVHAM